MGSKLDLLYFEDLMVNCPTYFGNKKAVTTVFHLINPPSPIELSSRSSLMYNSKVLFN